MATSLTLADVEAAIESIQTNGQSVEMDGMEYDAGNLQTLWNIRNQLLDEADRAAGTRPTMRRVKFTGWGY